MSNPFNPAVFDMRLGTLVHLYLRRLRSGAQGELLAAASISVGVGLVFAVLLTSAGITGSTAELMHGVIGRARLALVARSADGLPEALAEKIPVLPGVQAAAPILQQKAAIAGPRGRTAVQLIGVTPGIVSLGGAATRHLGRATIALSGGIGLPAEMAGRVGARQDRTLTVLSAGVAHRVAVRAVLGAGAIGPLAHSSVAVGPMGVIQRLSGRRGRVSQVLVQPDDGMDGAVAHELRRLARGRLDVVGADNELRQLQATAGPSSRATSLFAAIGGMAGFLLAFNAMLLTVPERRRTIADLRMQGFDWRQALVLIGFEALVLGVVASLVGIVLGDIASHAFLHRVPVYLALAFPIGSQQQVEPMTLLAALSCGLAATLAASLPVAADLRASRPRDAIFRTMGDGEAIACHLAGRLTVCGVALVAMVGVLALVAPALTLLSGMLLAGATLLLLPGTFTLFSRSARHLNERFASTALVVATRELRQVDVRTVALAGVGALAVFGSVTIGGARRDLLAGSYANFAEYLGTADLWVTTGDDDLMTNGFRAHDVAARIAAIPAVASVRAYQGELMDVGPRRMWLIARSGQDRTIVPPSQVLAGSPSQANTLLRAGGWVAVSNGFAREHGLSVGDALRLPTPAGEVPLHLAAITTNLGWPPGAVILNNADYSRWWGTAEPSALEVNLRPGTSQALAKRAVQRVLGAAPGLSVQTRAERQAQYGADFRQALESLREIALLLLFAAALAVAAVLSTAIWQRRPALAALKLHGYDRRQLWRALVIESTIVLSIGSAVGALLGIYGHLLANRWMKLSTGFPAPFSLGFGGMASDFALVSGIALLVMAMPGLLAARVSVRRALQDQV